MKDYKSIARVLCEAFLDMPSGCDGCPLYDENRIDEDGNAICALYDGCESSD